MAGDKPLPQAISPSAGTLYCSGQEPLLRTREPSDFITSGFTPDEHRAMEGWWGGLWLIGHRAGSRRRCARPCRRLDSLAWLCALPGPLRRVRGCPDATGRWWASSRPPRRRGKFTGAAERTLVLPMRPAAAMLVTGRAVPLTGEIETRFEEDGEDCDSTDAIPNYLWSRRAVHAMASWVRATIVAPGQGGGDVVLGARDGARVA